MRSFSVCCCRGSLAITFFEVQMQGEPVFPHQRLKGNPLNWDSVSISDSMCLWVLAGVLLKNILKQRWTKTGTRIKLDRRFYSTLLKLRPAESFSLGRSSCSWASRISTSCSIRRTEELTSPANTGPCVWRASSLAKLAAFSPLRI